MILWLHYFHTYECFSHMFTILNLCFKLILSQFYYFFYQKKSFKKWFGFGLGCGLGQLTRKKHGSGHESTFFCFGLKKLGSGQKILTPFSMSNQNPKTHSSNRKSQNWSASVLALAAIFSGTTRVSLLQRSVASLASEISGGLLWRLVRWEWRTRDKKRERWEWKHQREKERVRWRREKKIVKY